MTEQTEQTVEMSEENVAKVNSLVQRYNEDDLFRNLSNIVAGLLLGGSKPEDIFDALIVSTVVIKNKELREKEQAENETLVEQAEILKESISIE
jgi:hypothetical protein